MDTLLRYCNSNFKIEQKGRQRILIFPSRECPVRGTEVFVKNLPRFLNVFEVLSLMQEFGLIYCIRLIIDFSGYNKGYCYVSYLTEDSAKIATLVLNDCEIIPKFVLYVKMSYDNNKLLLRGVPWNITYSELNEDVLPAIKNGLINVCWKPWIGKKKDCVLEYGSHRQALEARKCIWPSINVWNVKIKIGWAKDSERPEIKYVNFYNLKPAVTRFELCIELLKILNIHSVSKIVLNNGKGYIAFSSERNREIALKKLKGHFFLDRINIMQNELLEDPHFPETNSTDGALIKIYELQPINTKPGMYNELLAITTAIRVFLSTNFTLYSWTCIIPKSTIPSKSIVVKIQINNKIYGYMLFLKYIKECEPLQEIEHC